MDSQYLFDFKERSDEIIALFVETFTASEGAEEGQLIGKLVRDLASKTKENDLFVFSSLDEGKVTGSIIFSRLAFEKDGRVVFILGPVAVKTSLQRRGIGQRLLRFGLDNLRKKGIDLAITYGDPNYYSKVGFAPITEEIAQAPLTLSHPEGWLAQSLTDRPLEPLRGPSRCVEALDSPAYW